MLVISSVFFTLSLGTVVLYTLNYGMGTSELGWGMAGIFMMIALVTFLRGVFSEKRMHDESHHSLP